MPCGSADPCMHNSTCRLMTVSYILAPWLQDLLAEGAAMRPEALSPLDGALAVLKQHAAEGGGLAYLPCCGKLAGAQACKDAEKYSC